MFFRSLFWGRTMLSLLEKVQKLPLNVLADIAKRAGGLRRTPMSVTGTKPTSCFARPRSASEPKRTFAL